MAINVRISKDTIPPGHRSRDSDYPRAGRFGDQIPVRAGLPAPVQTDPKAHPASCTKSAGPFPGGKAVERGADHPVRASAGLRMGRSYISVSHLC
jgi:hypothetical protein